MQQQLAVVDSLSRPDSSPEVIAAVDLGSNSFHMIVGELRHGQLIIIDRIRETVRLAEGLSASGDLSIDARARAIDCLARLGERLRDMHAASVRAAGTSTIRRAREDTGFMAEAESALGHPIEIISGIEEARLIYQGVTHSLPPHDGLRLVLDIGGGSTELILGRGAEPRALESVHLGCVSMTERFFPGGRITREAFDNARVAARLELRPVKAFFRGAEDVESIGTSGTIRSTMRVASELEIVDSHALTPDAVEQLIDRVIEFENIQQLSLSGLSERRAQVWPGGLAILAELLGVLRVQGLQVSDGALREGLLYDLLGRLQHEDARERSVRAMAARYNVDEKQAGRVARTAGMLLDQCGEEWQLQMPFCGSILEWSARLHEIGLDISHDGFHRHGAYVAANADLPGFPRAEQRFLAFLIGSQRNDVDTGLQEDLPRAWRATALRLALLLRLAVLLNRSRSHTDIPLIDMAVGNQSLELRFDADWLQANPLTIADLEREAGYARAVGYELSFR
jgi:exopolyphosphatase/guanosine-5'-triphosphate,3'-diphosphate pyrophosphatase